MDDKDALELARAYWSEPVGGDAWGEVTAEHAAGNSPDLPRIIAALVATVPPHESLSTIGTGVIESLHHGGADGPEIVRVLGAAELDADTIVKILSGVWPHLLDELGMRQHLRGLVSTARIEWLLDAAAPGRGVSL